VQVVLMLDPFVAGVLDGIEHDVADVAIGEAVGHLPTPTLGDEDPGGAQHAQVLGDERLGGAGLVDQFVDASGPTGDGGEQLQAKGVSQRPE
jgi:hypothetical protein